MKEAVEAQTDPDPPERKSYVRFDFPDVSGLPDIQGDLELGEEVTLTVTGKITAMDMRTGTDTYNHGASLTLEDLTVSHVATKKDDDMKEQLSSMENT